MIPSTGVLARSDTALVVIDIQERLAAAMARRELVIRRTALMIRAAAIVGVPILVTRQYPRGLGDVEPPLVEVLEEVRQSGATVLTADKVSFDCFCDATFCDAVAALGRRQLLVAGMETHICVTQTALAGLREAFDVHVAGDACCSREAEHHELALTRLGHAGAVITTSESACYELVGLAGTDEFKALLEAVKRQ
ncbi:MAG TPA: isochorismatase family protein [Coriobacteriia bacterium]|nr:isochorismatase family protein [Coriobacteriia bacterium]